MILCVCPNPAVDTFVWLGQLETGKLNRVEKEERFPGGKGVHVALAAAELGEDVALLGFWAGPNGDWIQEECRRRGVTCLGPHVEGDSRTCLTIKSTETGDETELLGTGPFLHKADLTSFQDAFEEALHRAGCVCLSGSWPVGAPDNAYADLVEIARHASRECFLDCSGSFLQPALKQRPFLVHINRIEAAHLWGGQQPQQLAFQLSRQCQWAALTAGRDGLFLGNADRMLHARCEVDRVHSPVGSGDCLLAGLAVAHSRKLDPIETARLAVACGAANCLSPQLGMLRRADVDRLVKKAAVTAL